MTDPGLLWRAARTLGRRARLRKPLPTLLFFTDPSRTPRPAQVVMSLPRGSAVVYRAFGAADAVAVGRRLAQIARRRGVAMFVGADAGLAVAVGADGIHLPQRLADRRGVILRLRRRFIVSAAAHDLAAVRAARLSGADMIVVSPVFDSASASAGRPLGARRFRGLVRRAGTPVYALGGVDGRSARGLANSGAAGLAAVGAFVGDPGAGPATGERSDDRART